MSARPLAGVVALLLAAGVALSPAAAAAAEPSPASALSFSPGPFADLLPGYWAFNAINDIARAGLALTPAANTFDPYGAETRAAWVEQVYLAVKGAPPTAPDGAPFPDVPPTMAGAGEIAQAAALGWLPYPAGADFSPTAPITRQEAFTILSRAFLGAGAPGTPLPFSDAAQIAPWAQAPLAALWAAGLISGNGAGAIAPLRPLSRADAAALLDAVLQHTLTVGGHRYRVLQVLTLRATAYGSAETGMGGTTATGTPVHVGEAAADPQYLPYGTKLWVTGYDAYGYLPPAGIMETIQDTGRLGPGRIDLYMAASGTWPLLLFGMQEVTAYVLAPTPLA